MPNIQVAAVQAAAPSASSPTEQSSSTESSGGFADVLHSDLQSQGNASSSNQAGTTTTANNSAQTGNSAPQAAAVNGPATNAQSAASDSQAGNSPVVTSTAVTNQSPKTASNAIAAQIDALLAKGVPLDQIAKTIVASVLATLSKQAGTNGSGTSAQSGDTSSALNSALVALINEITSSLQGDSTTTADGTDKSKASTDANQSSGSDATPSTLADATAALINALLGNAGATTSDAAGAPNGKTADQSSKSVSDAAGFIARTQNLLNLLAQGGDGANSSGDPPPKDPPKSKTGDDTKSTSAAQNIGTNLDALVAGVNPTQTLSSTTQTPAAGSATQNTTAFTSAVSDSVHQALGLAKPTTGSSGAANAANQPQVRSIAPTTSQAVANGVLLRSLERAVNAATGREGGSVDKTAQSIVADVQKALDTLAQAAAPSGAATTVTAGGNAAADAASQAIAAIAGGGSGNASKISSGITTPAAVSSTLASEDPHAVMSQIITGLNVQNVGSSPTVRISLTPPQLGDVTVRLSVNADRSVDATIATSSADVRATVLANSEQLARSLSDAGLKLNQLGVDLTGQGLTQDRENEEETQKAPTSRKRFAQAIDTTTPALEPTGPSILNNSIADLQLLNQLV